MVQEVTPPPKSLGCDPALRCGEKNNKKKKACITETFLVATDLEYCCCCCELLKTTSIPLLEFLQLYCIGLLTCHALLRGPVCSACPWQSQADRKVKTI